MKLLVGHDELISISIGSIIYFRVIHRNDLSVSKITWLDCISVTWFYCVSVTWFDCISVSSPLFWCSFDDSSIVFYVFFQNFSHGMIYSPPHNVISIMSVPGGIAIGTFGGNVTRVTSPESTSSNVSFNPMTSPRPSGHTSEASSGRSSMFDDMNRALSDIVNTSPGKNYQIYQLSSPGAVEANQTNQTTPTTSDITGSMTIPFDQTICDQLSKLKDMSSPTQTNDLLQLESPETNTPVGSEYESNFENNYLQNYARSPCYVSSPPKLGTIPEVPLSATTNVSEITSTASKTSTLSETRHNNQQSSTKPTTRHSASSISPDDQNDPVETNQVVSELDVFTHLFTDDQVEDSQH